MWEDNREARPHRVVIVGGGADGLELATRLGDKFGRKGPVEVTLTERSRTHVWKPKLHEIAAGSMDIAQHEVDYLAQSYWHGFRYGIGEMTGLDRERREVQMAPHYDTEGPCGRHLPEGWDQPGDLFQLEEEVRRDVAAGDATAEAARGCRATNKMRTARQSG